MRGASSIVQNDFRQYVACRIDSSDSDPFLQAEVLQLSREPTISGVSTKQSLLGVVHKANAY